MGKIKGLLLAALFAFTVPAYAGIGGGVIDPTARASAAAKATVFVQATVPTARGVGDLWFDSSVGLYPEAIWTGAAWQPLIFLNAPTTLYFNIAGVTKATINSTGLHLPTPLEVASGGTGAATAAAAIDALGGSLGVNQTWQNVTAARALNTTYTNSTGRTITVSVVASNNTAGGYGVFVTEGLNACYGSSAATAGGNTMVVCQVRSGQSYSFSTGFGTLGSIIIWNELR